MIPVRVSRRARQEAAEAAAWYEGRQDGLGRQFLLDAEKTVTSLATRKGRRLSGSGDPGVRFVPLSGPWPYRVLFVERSERFVIAFAHDRRAPGYWTDRMADDD